MASLAIGIALVQALSVARVPVSDMSDLAELARLGFEVASIEVDATGAQRAVIVVSADTRRLLSSEGFIVEEIPRAAAPIPAAPPANYFDFDSPVTGVRSQLEALALARSDVHLDSIGASSEGRPILAVKVGFPDDAPARPNVLFLATHHAREWVSTTMAMYLIRYLADSLEVSLRDARDVWVIPVVNPDGYQYSFDTERLWRKNRRVNSDGSVGVDLNRNYPQFWALDDLGSSGHPAAETYRGPSPASEPEVGALVRFHELHPPVLSVSYHTYTGLVLHPYGFASGAIAPDASVFRAFAGSPFAPAVLDHLVESIRSEYASGPGWHLYRVNGEYTDWAYRAMGTVAFTVELTSGCCVNGNWYGFQFPDDADMLDQVHADNLPLARAIIAEAGAPDRAIGPSGLRPSESRFRALWPEIVLVEHGVGQRTRRARVQAPNGTTTDVILAADSLDAGRYYTTFRGALESQPPRAIIAEPSAVAAELLAQAGGEPSDHDWLGWSVTTDLLVGDGAWRGVNDTLVSPEFDVSGRNRLWLQLWTRHAGSYFVPTRRGVVQYSDGGPWRDVAQLAGAAPEWYPVRVDLPVFTSGRLRLRFISYEMDWWLDAVALVTDEARSLVAAGPAATDGLVLSDNPVRGDRVRLGWPAPAGEVEALVYTFAGEPVFRIVLPAGTSEFEWDLTTTGGARVRDGGYIVAVRMEGTIYRRRLFVARGH